MDDDDDVAARALDFLERIAFALEGIERELESVERIEARVADIWDRVDGSVARATRGEERGGTGS